MIAHVLLLLILVKVFFKKDVFLLYVDTLLLLDSGIVVTVRGQVSQIKHGDDVLEPIVSALKVQFDRNRGRPVGARQVAQITIRVVIFWRERYLCQKVMVACHVRSAGRRDICHELFVLSQLDLAVLPEATLHEGTTGADHLWPVDKCLYLIAHVD